MSDNRKIRARSFRLLGAIAALIILLILKPWQLEFKTDQPVLAASDRLAILDFESVDGDFEFAKMVSALLITDLSESKYLQVVPRERLSGVVDFVSTSDEQIIGNARVKEVADQVNARWVLMGAIVEYETGVKVELQLVSADGSPLASCELTEGETDTNFIFTLVDKLTAMVKEALPLPDSAASEVDLNVANLTTSSPEAYRHYLRGLDYTSKLYYTEAQRSFETALAFDSAFAMAYYYLSLVEDPSLIDKAVEFADGVSPRERYSIMCRRAALSGDTSRYENMLHEIVSLYPDDKQPLLQLADLVSSRGNYGTAIDYLHRALKLDPSFRVALNQLAYLYSEVGDYQGSLEVCERYIK
ncbi:MAG: hypothetical protein ACW96N_07295, partial [Candidatus Thorarchaeota archaeon]